jgi:hypothetical protein
MMNPFFLCIQCGARNEALFRIFTKSALTLQTCVGYCSFVLNDT